MCYRVREWIRVVIREYGLEVVAYRKNDYFLARSPFEESLTLFR